MPTGRSSPEASVWVPESPLWVLSCKFAMGVTSPR
jgi:hypothetical protein